MHYEFAVRESGRVPDWRLENDQAGRFFNNLLKVEPPYCNRAYRFSGIPAAALLPSRLLIGAGDFLRARRIRLRVDLRGGGVQCMERLAL